MCTFFTAYFHSGLQLADISKCTVMLWGQHPLITPSCRYSPYEPLMPFDWKAKKAQAGVFMPSHREASLNCMHQHAYHLVKSREKKEKSLPTYWHFVGFSLTLRLQTKTINCKSNVTHLYFALQWLKWKKKMQNGNYQDSEWTQLDVMPEYIHWTVK